MAPAMLWSLLFLEIREDFQVDGDFWLQVLILAFLLVASGFFSGSEIGLFRLSRSRRQHLVEQDGGRSAQLLDRLMSNPDRALITILVGNNLVNIAAAAMATALAISIFERAAVGIATGVMTLLVLVFGEIIPKAYASRFSSQVSLRASPFLRGMQVLVFPVVWVFEQVTHFVFRLMGARTGERTFSSTEEIRTLIAVGEEEGVLEEEEREMLHSVIDFGELMAKEVMVPRTDMVCLAARTSVKEAVKVAVDSGFSRLPVYDGNLDNIVGIVFAKDLLAHLAADKGDVPVTSVQRQPLFVPESNTLDDVLRELQERRTHMALVVDEYGGTSGLVTMEDLLEEIVGEIFDEYDLRRESVRILDDETAVVDARVHVDDVNDKFGTKLPEDEVYETVAGFVFHTLGRIPKEGETFQAHGLRVTVEKAINRRILRVRMVKLPHDDPEDEDGPRGAPT
jgi:putative hemolysin